MIAHRSVDHGFVRTVANQQELRAGIVEVQVKNPASRGGQTVTTSVTVVESTALAFDPATLTTSVGAVTTVHAHFTPPPAAPITLLIDNSRPSVVDVPTFVIVGKDGNGSFSVRALANGAVGEAAGFSILKSNNVPNTTAEKYKIIAGHSIATTYVEQIVDLQTYKPEKRFGDGVKGLHVYGAKVVRPTALACLIANKS